MFSNSLAGKTALVTGAFGGLGRHFASTLAKAGTAVGVVGRRIDEGQKFADEIRAQGGRAFACAMDVTQADSVRAAFEQVAGALGPISVLVNNAGVAITKPFLDVSEDDWASVVDVNLTGAWRVAQAGARHMRDAKQAGSIINVASITGLRVAGAISAYVASKAGLIQLTKAMALELARYNIRVNALAPGYIETDINRDFFASEAGQTLIKRIPQRRIGKPEELEGPLLLLASDASSYMTGSVIVADGGHLVSSL
ncbi:MAG TPA: SDR family NAD(P)-dependent oxidoreductase [Burkholderiales bacterium]|nr:SDR family NAD(P)-dependent oxidoreductase [Burkholderiales bacterium]